MPDLRDAMKKVGLGDSTCERKCERCGKTFLPKEPHHKVCYECFRKEAGASRGPRGNRPLLEFSPDYPHYFDAEGVLKPEFVTTEAKRIADALGQARPKMTMHQLRAFYQHVKRQEGALKNGRALGEVLIEIAKLKPFANERANKEKIPPDFELFISRNVATVNDEKTFLKGFVEHFQAVVAYCSGTLER